MRLKLVWFIVSLFASFELSAASANYAHGLIGSSPSWTGTRWSAVDAALFGGMPHYSGADSHTLLLRYSYYVSVYMASNQEMKSLGTFSSGETSQTESFSLANVGPQMQNHKAPLWAKLETDCIDWAKDMGRVAVMSGPIYAPDPRLKPQATG